MRMAAVLVHHRTPDDTVLAVQSLLVSQRRPDEVIVVNNHEEDDEGRFLGRGRAEVVWLHAGSNRGFSGGVNLGIRSALNRDADAILLVNSDVIVLPDCLRRMEQAISKDASIGIVGPLIVSKESPDRIASMGISYNQTTGRMRHVGFGMPIRSMDVAAPRAVTAVSGCLMLIRASVFERAGLFDEDFFFGFEELEFCFRARRAGFATVLAGFATAAHEGGRSIGSTSPRRLYFAARNHLLLAYKLAPDESRFVRLPRVLSIALLNIAHSVTAQGGSLATRLQAVTQGTLDYLNGRFGSDRGR